MTDLHPDLTITDLPDASPSDPLEALSWLGDTVEEVVEGLRARGIKGQTAQPNACPLHNYLAGFGFDVFTDVSATTEGEIHLNDDRIWNPVLYTFVCEFDDKLFPDLIDNG